MNVQTVATLAGIVLQVAGSGYLVWQARHTSLKLAGYRSNVTWDNFAPAIDALAHELHDQFKLQLRGFAAIAVGSMLQFYGAIPP